MPQPQPVERALDSFRLRRRAFGAAPDTSPDTSPVASQLMDFLKTVKESGEGNEWFRVDKTLENLGIDPATGRAADARPVVAKPTVPAGAPMVRAQPRVGQPMSSWRVPGTRDQWTNGRQTWRSDAQFSQFNEQGFPLAGSIPTRPREAGLGLPPAANSTIRGMNSPVNGQGLPFHSWSPNANLFRRGTASRMPTNLSDRLAEFDRLNQQGRPGSVERPGGYQGGMLAAGLMRGANGGLGQLPPPSPVGGGADRIAAVDATAPQMPPRPQMGFWQKDGAEVPAGTVGARYIRAVQPPSDRYQREGVRVRGRDQWSYVPSTIRQDLGPLNVDKFKLVARDGSAAERVPTTREERQAQIAAQRQQQIDDLVIARGNLRAASARRQAEKLAMADAQAQQRMWANMSPSERKDILKTQGELAMDRYKVDAHLRGVEATNKANIEQARIAATKPHDMNPMELNVAFDASPEGKKLQGEVDRHQKALDSTTLTLDQRARITELLGQAQDKFANAHAAYIASQSRSKVTPNSGDVSDAAPAIMAPQTPVERALARRRQGYGAAPKQPAEWTWTQPPQESPAPAQPPAANGGTIQNPQASTNTTKLADRGDVWDMVTKAVVPSKHLAEYFASFAPQDTDQYREQFKRDTGMTVEQAASRLAAERGFGIADSIAATFWRPTDVDAAQADYDRLKASAAGLSILGAKPREFPNVTRPVVDKMKGGGKHLGYRDFPFMGPRVKIE